MARAPSKKAAAAGERADASHRIVILHGKDRFVQDERLGELREALVQAHGQVDTIRFDGLTAAAADVLDECRSSGLMQQHKLVIVDAADAFLKAPDDGAAPPPAARPGRRAHHQKDNREVLAAYAAAPSDSATLVLRADTLLLGNLGKSVPKVGIIIPCEPPRDDEAVAWARNRCRERHGTTLAPDAAALLVQTVGPDLGRIDTELAKLALLTPGSPITADQVGLMVGATREDKFWAIQKHLLGGNPAVALHHLREAIEVSRHDPVALNWSFIDLARKLHGAARGLAQRENPFALVGRLRLWGDSKDLILDRARRISADAAAGLLREAVEADTRLKSGGGDPVRNLEVLTLRFASVLHR